MPVLALTPGRNIRFLDGSTRKKLTVYNYGNARVWVGPRTDDLIGYGFPVEPNSYCSVTDIHEWWIGANPTDGRAVQNVLVTDVEAIPSPGAIGAAVGFRASPTAAEIGAAVGANVPSAASIGASVPSAYQIGQAVGFAPGPSAYQIGQAVGFQPGPTAAQIGTAVGFTPGPTAAQIGAAVPSAAAIGQSVGFVAPPSAAAIGQAVGFVAPPTAAAIGQAVGFVAPPSAAAIGQAVGFTPPPTAAAIGQAVGFTPPPTAAAIGQAVGFTPAPSAAAIGAQTSQQGLAAGTRLVDQPAVLINDAYPVGAVGPGVYSTPLFDVRSFQSYQMRFFPGDRITGATWASVVIAWSEDPDGQYEIYQESFEVPTTSGRMIPVIVTDRHHGAFFRVRMFWHQTNGTGTSCGTGAGLSVLGSNRAVDRMRMSQLVSSVPSAATGSENIVGSDNIILAQNYGTINANPWSEVIRTPILLNPGRVGLQWTNNSDVIIDITGGSMGTRVWGKEVSAAPSRQYWEFLLPRRGCTFIVLLTGGAVPTAPYCQATMVALQE